MAKVRDDKPKLSQLTAELFLLNVIMTLIGFAAFGVFMACSKKAAVDPLLYWICIFPMLLGPIGFSWLFEGCEEYTFIMIRSLCVRIISLVLILLIVKDVGDYWKYAFVLGVGVAGTNLVNLFHVRKFISVREVKCRKLQLRKHLKSIFIFAATSALVLFFGADKVMLGLMRGDNAVGIYTVPWRLCQVIAMIPFSIILVTYPRMSRLITRDE